MKETRYNGKLQFVELLSIVIAPLSSDLFRGLVPESLCRHHVVTGFGNKSRRES